MAEATAQTPSGFPSSNPSKSFWHKEPSSILLGHRSSQDLPQHADVVIIGSGMTGASVAWHLLNQKSEEQRSGPSESLDVVLLEAREVCWGATGRNGGHCQPVFFDHPNDPSIGHFELTNFRTIQKLSKELGIDCEFVEQPGVRALYSDHYLKTLSESIRTVRLTDPELGERMKLVTDVEELKKLRIPTAKGAVVTNVAGRMWPYKFVAGILERLLANPTSRSGTFNLQTNTTATSITRADDVDPDSPEPAAWKVSTADRGSIVASYVVLATNAYTPAILPEFADLLVPARGQMSSLVPSESLAGENRLQTSFGFLGHGQDDYLVQRPNETGGHLMFGGGRAYGPSLGVSDDSTIDENTARYLRHALIDHLGPYAHQSNLTPTTSELSATHEWTGIMSFSRDNLPWVGPVPNRPSVFMSAGYTGHGMPNAWLCGGAVGKMILEKVEDGFVKDDVQMNESEEANSRLSKTRWLDLPRSYMASAERMERARAGPTVRELDLADGFNEGNVEF